MWLLSVNLSSGIGSLYVPASRVDMCARDSSTVRLSRIRLHEREDKFESDPTRRGDEPMVVLDTAEDWRFAKNVRHSMFSLSTRLRLIYPIGCASQPLVVGPPHARFYAGAPLRTAEGYNIGALAIMDDIPRQEFSPRQRHTLKEFAVSAVVHFLILSPPNPFFQAIAMREMELWRDKVRGLIFAFFLRQIS